MKYEICIQVILHVSQRQPWTACLEAGTWAGEAE